MVYPMTKNIAIFLCFGLVTFAASAKQEFKVLNHLFEKSAASQTVPGISVAIANSGGIQWAQGFGYSDIENKIAMTSNTKLRVGSISKVLTTAALMRLFEQGKIDFDTPVVQIVSEWPKHHPTITLKHLVSHTSGIRHYDKQSEFLSNKQYNHVVDSLKIFKNDPLEFSPGSAFGYSTYAWSLISAYLEKADRRRNFRLIMQQEVFSPLNMRESQLENNQQMIENLQKAYTVKSGRLVPSLVVNNSNKYAGGGMLSTPTDLVKFALAHTHNNFLKNSSLKMMFTNAMLENGKAVTHGIGWRVGFDSHIRNFMRNKGKFAEDIALLKRHQNSVFHSGGSMGASSMLILCLDHKHAAAVIKNVDGDRSTNLFNLAMKALDNSYHEKN